MYRGFPGGAVVKNLPANAGDTGSSPGLGRSHMPQSNYACVPQLLSLHSGAHESQLLSPPATTTEARAPRAHALQQEKPPQCEARAPQQRTAPSIDRWMDKNVTYIYNGILLRHKEKRNWVICSEVYGSRVCHTEWSKSETEKQIPYANTYIWNLK